MSVIALELDEPATVVLAAPTHGVVRFLPPSDLCGELEVYGPGEPVAAVDDSPVHAPSRGFVRQRSVMDGDRVQAGAPLVSFVIS